ncbi:MAG: BMP family ABC transporter substrate-binding protein [Lachnospiraceae bacterium]|nr:BMP family ABC transporter substrate-binding protein [Lachnospiraceae bacterium]
MKKKLLALALSGILAIGITACGGPPAVTDAPADEPAAAPAETTTEAPAEEASGNKVYNVAYLVNGNLGDKSFFDSAKSGLDELEAAGRIKCTTIEMGGTDEDQPRWASTLDEVSADGSYDLIICGTYQMPDYLKEAATNYPDQKYAIFDDTTYVGENSNVVNLSYRQNDMGYLIGVFAAGMTTDTSVENINEDPVVGFVGGVDSPVINDFLLGFIEGAQSVNPDIKVDVRYTNDYVDTAIAKEYGLSMINDNKCDIVWGVAGNAGNGAAEAALETGKAWFIGVDSDQELTLSPDLAALTLTSGLKNIGNSLIWLFDEWDAGNTYWGTEVNLGIAEGGVGIVTDKNFDKYASDETKAAVKQAEEDILAGKVTVDSAIGDTSGKVEELKKAVQP